MGDITDLLGANVHHRQPNVYDDLGRRSMSDNYVYRRVSFNLFFVTPVLAQLNVNVYTSVWSHCQLIYRQTISVTTTVVRSVGQHFQSNYWT